MADTPAQSTPTGHTPTAADKKKLNLPPSTTPPLRALWLMLRNHKVPLIAAIILSAVSAAVSLAQPMVINRLISSVGENAIAPYVWTLIGLLIVASVLGAVQMYLLGRTAESAVFTTRRQLISRMLRLPIQTFDNQRTGDLVTRIGSDTTLVRTAITGGLVDALGSVVTIVGAVILMALLDPLMLGVVLGVLVLTMTVMVSVSSLIQKYTVQTQEALGDLGADMERSLGAIRTIRAHNAQGRMNEELDGQAHKAFRASLKIAKIEALLWPMAGAAMQISFLAVLGIGGVRVANGDIAVADLVTFVLFLFMVAMPLGTLFGAVTTVRSALGALTRIHQVLDSAAEPVDGREVQLTEGEVIFDGVEFGYEENGPILKDVSFTVPAGTMTALVGPSGAGKSTTLSLLERFYDPNAGQIIIDGHPITEISRESLRGAIGYVEQDAPVLAGSVRYNLHLAAPDASDEQCWDALRHVNLEKRFEGDEGLDTPLGERGVSLSGGERQRLALARVLLSDAPIMLLDEPTAAVDSQNEQLILDAINTTARGRTLIVVAHRLSTVTDADQIIVMQDGQVESRGTHRELLQRSDLYRELASRQLLSD
ncbi:Multidrug resistance ABC transporter ATP-binding/permease protein BmrA [Corynebacterium occultum]|uniref:Multidrug resistance ABC transporter ATP-binding/permease protein BmrA n=1 Tax=Corynebacterium occultum TaxID=2675219 RepID=A0A6B8WB96_9CORY|nr:ABC transporter ATP-binding protein [Corynebacterium occultum]QGU08116.1 Multidrug resistance ABC transporter ATP-binding/permease protein BmrA [Corynebacterium occultum]